MMRRSRAYAAAVVVAPLIALPFLSDAARADDKSDKQMCIAAAEQGQSQRDDGQYRAARDSFLKCTNEKCPRVIVQSCTKWLRELDESAPTIVLGAKDDQGNDLNDVKVTFDGAPFATTLTGKPMEADAGEHVVRFEREGSIPVEQKLLLRAGERARVVSVTLLPVPVPRDADASASETEEAEAPPPPPPPEPVFSAHHVTSGAIGLGAVAAAVTAVAFLVESNKKQSDAQNIRGNLPSDACTGVSSAFCSHLAQEVQSQHDELNIATGFFIGAGALAVGAVASWVFWPKQEGQAPQTTGSLVPVPGGATLQVTGTFR
jgi:hypothetical protein